MKKQKRAIAAKAGKGGRSTVKRKTVASVAAPPARVRSKRADRGRDTVHGLRRELAAALRRIEELEAIADTDFLLGIPNRRGFEHALHRAIAYIQRYNASGALIVLDVDLLKPINDSYGHAAGDEVLKAIAATLTGQVRSSDVVGRLGGDEFVVLLWNLSETDARAKAAGLEQAIDGLTFEFDGRSVTAGASAGVALLGSHVEAGRAMAEADAAMYVRKAQRRHERQMIKP
ncbi:MAG: GGDEF domain-containing protein [Bradyrhizobium sp.]|uniref:GGDEF domain-containing protein n=1 Tax=Bradyrhizobium sp. TaxID=376 RepID=UPI0025B9B743|nr:GGDEF domain-containing protein [Bradyrhizobium sp.]MBI5264390.1 GGDEF domain-containing protein [Bradyrhizobium sp.]